MSDDATLDQQGAPGMDAPPEGQEPATTIPNDQPVDGAAAEETGQDPPKSKRELAMEAIEASRNEQFEAESGLRIAGPDAAGSDGDGATAGEEEPEGRSRQVKVDGEVLEVTDDEIRQYQKGLTADRRLEQAAEERKRIEVESARLEADRAEFERTRAGGSARAGSSSDDDSQATPIGDDGAARKLYEDLTSGDEEAAIAAIKELKKGRQAEAIPPETVTARVLQEIDWRDAQSAFAKGYPDIVADPLLTQIASNTLTQTLKTSETYDQAFAEAGDRTRAWVRKLNAGSTQDVDAGASDPGRVDKQSRKERIDLPTAINARAAGQPQEEVAKPSTIIKEMRQGRGQPA
jgi:hypothetical protein